MTIVSQMELNALTGGNVSFGEIMGCGAVGLGAALLTGGWGAGFAFGFCLALSNLD